MKKRFLSLLLTAALVLGLAGVLPAAAANLSGSCGDSATWSLEGGTLTISGTGEMYNYSSEEPAPWLPKAASIEQVVVEPGITRLGDSAFDSLENVTEVRLPEGLLEIGHMALRGTAIPAVEIPGSVTSIGHGAFTQCAGLKEITIPEKVTFLGMRAFYGCPALTRVTVLSRDAEISENALGMVFGSKDGKMQDVPVADFVLLGYRNSTTNAYARQYGLTFQPLDPAPAVEFTDVPEGKYYTAPVAWAVANEVTAGTSKTTFSPEQPCTRAQIVTFLWRAAGKPAPTAVSHNFTDVKPGAYYEKAVLWAVEKGITAGTSETTFSPERPCTRAQAVSFLYRFRGSPEAEIGNPFYDVPEESYYTRAVLWAVANEVTAGTSRTTFSPDQSCTRGQIVTFLYRAMNG